MASNGRGSRGPVKQGESKNGYFLVVFHAVGPATVDQAEVAGSIAEATDCVN